MNKKIGVIYKIHSNDLNITDIYIGSTRNLLARISRHKYNCNTLYNKKYNRLLYKFIRDHGGWCNWSITPIRLFDVIHDTDLLKIERRYIENYKPSLNQLLPYRDMCEYRIKYICECGKRYTIRNITTHNKTLYHKKYVNDPFNRLDLEF